MSSTSLSMVTGATAVSHTFTRAPDVSSQARAAMQISPPGLDALQRCVSISSLHVALSALCSGHGDVLRLDIVPAGQAGRRQAVCFLRMQTAAQEHSLMRALGIGRFGGELVLVVKLATPQQHH